MAAEKAFYLRSQVLGLPVKEVTRMDMNYLSAINKSSSKPVSVQIDKDDIVTGDDAVTKTARGSLSQKNKKAMLFELHFR